MVETLDSAIQNGQSQYTNLVAYSTGVDGAKATKIAFD
jgi:hypothetical protein